jgi:hypothetical protein
MQNIAILLMFVVAAPLQRIETQFPDRARVTRVETAMNHLTVIELAEPVTLAAAGSPLFKIERRDNKVFIQPLEEGASTNLFVWTGSGRWSYELVSVASSATMHFAIDQQIAPSSQSQHAVTTPAKSASAVSPSFAEQMLLFAKPIRNIGVKFGPNEVGTFITDVYRKGEQLFIRYVIDNRTAEPYVVGIPDVFALESTQSKTSLHAVRYSQVGPDMEKKIRSQRQVRIATVDCEVPPGALPPGETASGILILQLDRTASEPAVLRFLFPRNGRNPISVTVVL